jgi:DNA segregation ATPase FtsK/SpoIIIE, S-DNA-T family
MTNESPPEERNAEIVPLRPEHLQPAPEVLAAVPVTGKEIELAAGHAPAVPVYADITGVPGERLPIIPPNLRGRANIKATIVLAGGQQWHRARYHGLRFPLYLLAALAWAVIGLFRVIGRQVHWWWVIEQHELRSQAAAAGDSREWMRLHKEAKQTRQVRGIVLACELVALLIAALALWLKGPWWSWYAVAVVALPLLARAGRPEDRRIISPAIIPPDYSPPTHEIISRALGSLGIPEINRALKPDSKTGVAAGIRFVSDVMRDGPGWGCHLDLPHGVTATDILARREELASGLRRPLSATWPAGVPEVHPGRLELWVGFQDLSKTKPPAWPLLKAGQADVFASLPFGTDPRGRPVPVPLFETNWLIGASPGQGKTAAVRCLACCVALDPLADLGINELSGKGDLEPLAKVCDRYVSGLDDESIAYAAESARLLRVELDRRSKHFGTYPRTAKPEGKLTRELAARDRKLRPRVEIFDEVQNLLMHPEHGRQAAEDLAYVIRVGRALGIIVILSTQRPDKESVPPAVTGLIICRFCLMVPGQVENDMVLGTSAYKNGYKSTSFRPKVDAGLGWLKGSEDGIPQITRTYYLNLPACERIASRARDIRDRAGVLTGYALGEVDDAAPRDVLADVLAVLGDDAGLHWAELADRLANRWPDRWSDISAESLSAQLRSLGVPSVDVRMGGTVLKGCRRVGVEKAAQR